MEWRETTMLASNFSIWLINCLWQDMIAEQIRKLWLGVASPFRKMQTFGKLCVGKSLSGRLPEPFVYMSLYFCEERTCLFQNMSNANNTWQCTCKMSWNFVCETYCAKVKKIRRFSNKCSFSIRPKWGWTFTLSEVACFFRTREELIFMLAEDRSLHGKKCVCSTTILRSVKESRERTKKAMEWGILYHGIH